MFENTITLADARRNGADRQAAQALRMRRDWKNALRLPLGDAGCDFSLLSAFRERPIERQCQPGEHEVDAGYMRGPNLAHSKDLEIDLIGPCLKW